jgi:hypothetical protein
VPTATIVLDVPGSASDVVAFYQRALADQGWSAAQGGPFAGLGGFQGTGMGPGLAYCQTPDGPSLTLSAYPEARGLSDVRLAVASGPGLCSPLSGVPAPRVPAGAERIPRLYPPEGVILQTSFGGGGGQDRWTSEAVAVTDQSSAALEGFFAQQLAAAGWTRQAGRPDTPLAWSIWQVPGEGDWQGLLLVVEGPGPNRRSLSVRAESPTSSSGSVGIVLVLRHAGRAEHWLVHGARGRQGGRPSGTTGVAGVRPGSDANGDLALRQARIASRAGYLERVDREQAWHRSGNGELVASR